MSGTRLTFIQGLRGIAALMVVLWHASRYLGPYGTGIGGRLFSPAGPMGVHLFFLVSGFIMVHTTRSNDGSWKYCLDFAIKRATRIWPVWIAALTAYLTLHRDIVSLTDPVQRAWLAHSIALLPTAGAPGDVAPVYGFPVLGVGWTLNYEMYFYAFFGVAMLFGRWRWLALFGWLTATAFLIPYCTGRIAGNADWFEFLSLSPLHDYRYTFHYLGLMTNPLILAFAAGVVMGLIHRSPFTIESVRLQVALLAAAIIAVVLQYACAFRIGYGLFGWGLSLVPLTLMLVIASKRLDLTTPRWLVYLGDISFSLYLFHPTVQEAFDHMVRACGYFPTGYFAIIVTTSLSLAVASLAHRYIERGLCEYLKNKLLRLLPRIDSGVMLVTLGSPPKSSVQI